MGEATNLKVAVRVRPFNDREKSRKATLIVNMSGKTTEIRDPENLKLAPKNFAFDYSYWSHDGYKEEKNGYLSPVSSIYADQKKVFEDMGRDLLSNAWKGYNCSLFAYGQTGSGKSYSMVGYEANKGIVPVSCEELFKEIDQRRNKAKSGEDFQVSFSMLEIYNEQVRDLLNYSKTQKGGLKVRQHAEKGFYVEGLKSVSVNSYKDIESQMYEGTRNRTVAATNMNATSSRAHTIVAIQFTQKTVTEAKRSMTRTSVINLVDLAGSERAASTGASGDRLREGASINQSLSTLGNTIKALADIGKGKRGVKVPYRDSTLTKLLQNAIGGNSKTLMIAALSPADINYDETLSTLRFADRAKEIKTKAIVNESPTDRLIRELRDENQRLMEMLKKGNIPSDMLSGDLDEDSKQENLQKAMEELTKKNEEEVEALRKSYEDRLKDQCEESQSTQKRQEKLEEERKCIPHLWNLNEDSTLTGIIVHFCREGETKVGNGSDDSSPDVNLKGLSVQKEHASIVNKKKSVSIIPGKNAKILINGQICKKETLLHHNDRVLFGSSHLYVFHHPQDYAKMLKEGGKRTDVKSMSFREAQEEIAEKEGYVFKEGLTSKEDYLLQEELVQIIPMVNEVSAISEELDKKILFDVALVSPTMRGLQSGRTEVFVKVRNLENGNEWLWDRDKFISRRYIMQDMYQNFIDGEKTWDLPKEQDPFWEPADTNVLIGVSHIFLASIAVMLDSQSQCQISDVKTGSSVGSLSYDCEPCTPSWEPLKEDVDVFEPSDLLGKSLHFKFRIREAQGLPKRFQTTHCRFKFYLDENWSITQEVKGTSPDYNFEARLSFGVVTQQLLSYLETGFPVEIWGKQKVDGDKKEKGTTKEMIARDKTILRPGRKQSVLPAKNFDEKLMTEINTYKKRAERAEAKLRKLNKMVKDAKQMKKSTIKVPDLNNAISKD